MIKDANSNKQLPTGVYTIYFIVSVKFIDCTFHKKLVFSSSTVSSLSFINVRFSEAEIKLNRHDSEIILDHFQGNNLLLECTGIKLLRSSNSIFLSSKIFSRNVDLVEFTQSPVGVGPKMPNVLHFHVFGSFQQIYVQGCYDSLLIEGAIPSGSTMTLSNLMVGKLKLMSLRNLGILYIDSVQPMKPKKEDALVGFFKCLLDNAQFHNFNFDGFDQVFIGDSQIANVQFTSCTIPRNGSKFLDKLDAVHSDKVDLFRQLKFAFEKQMNIIEAQYFHGLEMKEHKRKLIEKKQVGFATEGWEEAAVIWFSDVTSRFGQSWGRPFLLLIGIHFFLLWVAILFDAFPDLHFSCSGTWNGFIKGCEYFGKTILPTHKIDADTFTGGTIFLNLIMRVVSAYMIYNIIRASRRFIK